MNDRDSLNNNFDQSFPQIYEEPVEEKTVQEPVLTAEAEEASAEETVTPEESLPENEEPAVKPHKGKKIHHLAFTVTAIIIICFFGIISYTVNRTRIPTPSELDEGQKTFLAASLFTNYPQEVLKPLPYTFDSPELTVAAKAAIVLDAANGCVLYEKNGDEVIPPASMQKLMAMYIVFTDIAAGKFTLTDTVPIVSEAFAKNAPPGSSLMGLHEGDVVTVDDLLMGMAVPSGNDAAVAIGNFVSGSTVAFVRRMNEEAAKLGLKNTFFADISGYSELNLTTPREFAAFCRIYSLRFPDAMKRYNGAQEMQYPLARNIGSDAQPRETRTLKSTNKLLTIIPGCDGLKTGYIPEAGYNFSFTAKNGSSRVIAILMGGKGSNRAEGDKYRISDVSAIANWFYGNFETLPTTQNRRWAVKVWGGEENSVYLTESLNSAITVPNLMKNAVDNVQESVEIPRNLTAPIEAGTEYGKIVYRLGNNVLQEIPLVADRNIEEGSLIKKGLDKIAKVFVQ